MSWLSKLFVPGRELRDIAASPPPASTPLKHPPSPSRWRHVRSPQPVADAEGNLAGWVLPETARARAEIDEARAQTPSLDDKGVPVQDLDGNVVGYLLPWYGRFVPISLARVPGMVEKLNLDRTLTIKNGRVFRSDGTLA